MNYGAESSLGVWGGQLLLTVLSDEQQLPGDHRYDTGILSHLFHDAQLLKGYLEGTSSAQCRHAKYISPLKYVSHLFCILQPTEP